MNQEPHQEIEPIFHPPAHYYGDIVRRLFVGGALVSLLSLPLFLHMFPFTVFYPLLAVIVLALVAGLVNPKQKLIHYMGAVTAAVSLVFFEWSAVVLYGGPSHGDWHSSFLFWLSYALAVNFFFAFYFNIKTIRGMLLRR